MATTPPIEMHDLLCAWSCECGYTDGSITRLPAAPTVDLSPVEIECFKCKRPMTAKFKYVHTKIDVVPVRFESVSA